MAARYPNGGFVSYLWPNPVAARATLNVSEPFNSVKEKVDWLRDSVWLLVGDARLPRRGVEPVLFCVQGFIDLGTRVVFVDLNVYNANVDMWIVVSLMVEFPATGGTVVSSSCVQP